jgi:hypothetical protein
MPRLELLIGRTKLICRLERKRDSTFGVQYVPRSAGRLLCGDLMNGEPIFMTMIFGRH